MAPARLPAAVSVVAAAAVDAPAVGPSDRRGDPAAAAGGARPPRTRLW